MAKKETEKKVVKKAVVKTQNYNHDEVTSIAKAFAKSIGAETGIQHINRKEPFDCVTIKRHNKTIAWFLPRSGKNLRYTVYLFGGGPKQIIDVTSDAEQNKAFDEITAIYNSIDDKPTKKKVTTPKKNNEIRPIDKIIEQLKGLGKNKGLAIPNGYDATDNELVKAVEKHGFRIDAEKKIIIRA